MTTIALLGVGKLGEALLSGLLRSGTPVGSMLAAERHSERAAEIAERYGVQTPTPEEATARADVVLLAVKPQDMRALLTDIAPHLRPETLVVVEDLLTPVGKVVRVPESQQDAVTALSGSGPAYFFFLVEAMIDAGILLGLPRAVAAELIVQTAVGSARMLRESGEHPVLLREAVTSPGGTTIAAIRTMEDHGVRAAMLAAIEAARDRSRELAAGG
jgi:pyrroline-5-carboxylate reductase